MSKLFGLAVVVGALSFTACSKKDKDAPAPATSPAGSPAAPPSTAAAPPSAGKLDCTKIMAPALRDKYFAGAKFEDNPAPVETVGECKITAADGAWSASVSVTCHDNMAAAMTATLDGLKKNMPEAKDLPGVGKAAVVIPMGENLGTMVTAFDDDSNCMATITAPPKVDPAAFAKDLLATLPVK